MPSRRVSLLSVRTIVVASDAPSVRADVVTVLGNPEDVVVEVSSGPQAIEVVVNQEVDLLVVDIQMSNMGGMAVCMELRLEASYGKLPHVPVLMLLDRRPDVFLARRSGAEGWLVKPLDPRRLRRAMNALMDGQTYHDESSRPLPVSRVTVDAAQGSSSHSSI